MKDVLLCVGFIVLYLFFVKARGWFYPKSPVQTAQAVVLSRRGEMPNKSYSNFHATKMRYFATFSLGSDKLELSVSSSQYTRLIEGSSGELNWRDKELVSFKPETD